MEYSHIAEDLARDFQEEPYNFITKMDLQVQLNEKLKNHLRQQEAARSTLEAPFLHGNTVSYKERLQATIQEQMEATGEFDRIHNDVSIEQGHRFNIAVFSESISNPIEWVGNGSKRFDEEDLEAVFELEFVINKAFFHTEGSIRDDRLLTMNERKLRNELNMEENNVRSDFEALGRLPSDVETYYLLFSNNNYLFRDPLSRAEKAEQKKVRVGKAAQKQIQAEAEAAETTVYYAHPRGYTSLTE